MAQPIDFYFDFSSPYGYIASHEIEGIAAKHDREVSWRPMLLGASLKVMGQPPLIQVPLKGEYARRDFERTAKFHGVEFNFPPAFPIASIAPTRAFYWLADNSSEDAKKLAKALLRAYFVDGREISVPEITIEVVKEQGFDATQCAEALSDPRHKERVKNEVELAISKGVFGSPFVIVDGEPFWGSDRLDQVDKWLETGGW